MEKADKEYKKQQVRKIFELIIHNIFHPKYIFRMFISRCKWEESNCNLFQQNLAVSDRYWTQLTKQTNTRSKSTMETLEKGVKTFQVNNKNTRTTSLMSFWYLFSWIWTHFALFCTVSIDDLEQVNVCWDIGGS